MVSYLWNNTNELFQFSFFIVTFCSVYVIKITVKAIEIKTIKYLVCKKYKVFVLHSYGSQPRELPNLQIVSPMELSPHIKLQLCFLGFENTFNVLMWERNIFNVWLPPKSFPTISWDHEDSPVLSFMDLDFSLPESVSSNSGAKYYLQLSTMSFIIFTYTSLWKLSCIV